MKIKKCIKKMTNKKLQKGLFVKQLFKIQDSR